jgi:predicted PurR-regulated permease PerM
MATMNQEADITVSSSWTVRRVVTATLVVLAVAAIFLFFYRFSMVFFLLFVAIALHVAIEPAVVWLSDHRIPKGAGVFGIYLLLFALLGALGWFAIPLIIEQAWDVMQQLPELYQRFRSFLLQSTVGLVRGLALLLPAEPTLPFLMALSATDAANTVEPVSPWHWVEIGSQTLFGLYAVFALALYWTLEGEIIIRRLILKVPTKHRTELRTLLAEMQGKIGGYFRGQAILMAAVGGAATTAFLLLGIPNALLLGLLMAIFEIVPMVGPLLGAIPALLMTMGAEPDKVLIVAGVLLAIQIAENNWLVPRVMDESVGVNPIVSLLALGAFGALFGFVGALLAVPLAAALQIILQRLLFAVPISAEAPVVPTLPPDMSRSKLGVLRLEATRVAEAIRRQGRQAPDGESRDTTATRLQVDRIADEIEDIALDLDALLAEGKVVQ